MSARRPRVLLGQSTLQRMTGPTPFLALDLDVAAGAYARLRAALPGVDLHYAVKCNPEPALLRHLHELGAGFEIASLAELDLLESLGVDAAEVLSSNPVKPPAHIAGSHAAGVQCFAADSLAELEKLAAHAPGSRIYVRMAVDDPTSRVPLAGKFGVDARPPATSCCARRRSGWRRTA